MKVLTRFGVGEIPGEKIVVNNRPLDISYLAASDPVAVLMDSNNDPLGKTQTFPKREIYEVGDDFVVRVANIQGAGLFSNVLPFSETFEARIFYDAPIPGGEMRFLLNLGNGTFEASHELGITAQRYFRVNPWLDRWGKENMEVLEEPIEDMEQAVRQFDEEIASCSGTSGGISTSILLDLANNKILRMAVAVTAPRGIVYDMRLGC